MILFLLISGFICSALLTYLMRLYALKYDVLDIPVARSSHEVPTPRGGGMAIVATMLLMMATLWLLDLIKWQYALAIILPGSIIAMIGFWDDHHPIGARPRIVVHFIAAILALWLLPEIPGLPFSEIAVTSYLILFPLYVIVLVWLLNLYNFMDGIDGIAGAEAVSTLLAAAVILHFHIEPSWLNLLLCIAAPVGGFLVWNWAPAKIFMGDGGSGFVGFTLGVVALITAANTDLNVWSWFILLAVFIGDATWTLIKRFATGQRWSEPHRSHSYQILARRTSHATVSTGIIVINLLWLAPLAALALALCPHSSGVG